MIFNWDELRCIYDKCDFETKLTLRLLCKKARIKFSFIELLQLKDTFKIPNIINQSPIYGTGYRDNGIVELKYKDIIFRTPQQHKNYTFVPVRFKNHNSIRFNLKWVTPYNVMEITDNSIKLSMGSLSSENFNLNELEKDICKFYEKYKKLNSRNNIFVNKSSSNLHKETFTFFYDNIKINLPLSNKLETHVRSVKNFYLHEHTIYKHKYFRWLENVDFKNIFKYVSRAELKIIYKGIIVKKGKKYERISQFCPKKISQNVF